MNKLLGKIKCFLGDHEWTSAAEQGKKPTQDQLDRGLKGFAEFAVMYCDRCGKENNLSRRWRKEIL